MSKFCPYQTLTCTIVQAYGEVKTLYTACIARGFIMITYFDLRAACLAMHSLQGATLDGASLDIHFSAPRDGTPENHEVRAAVGLVDGGLIVCLAQMAEASRA